MGGSGDAGDSGLGFVRCRRMIGRHVARPQVAPRGPETWEMPSMKSLTEYLTFNVPARMDFVNITPQVEEIVRRSGVQEGLVLCNQSQQ
jgi:hypothetical protein